MSAYASLMNIDSSLPTKLAAFVAGTDAASKNAVEASLSAFIANSNTSGFIGAIFDQFENIMASSPDEGKISYSKMFRTELNF